MNPYCGYLFIRAAVPEVDIDAFDHWYQTEHLARATAALGASAAWRFWSPDERPESIHYAVYEFESPTARDIALASSALPVLVKEFDAAWGSRVHRVRSRIQLAQQLSSSLRDADD